MSPADGGASFVWVNSTGQDSVGQQHANKRKVRQQVRKHVGDQWKTSRKQTLQIRQGIVHPAERVRRSSFTEGIESRRSSDLPKKPKVRETIEEVEEFEEVATGLEPNALAVAPRAGLSIANPGLVGYDAARARYDFDLSWLSSLTISHVGSMRSADGGLKPWLQHRETTFLDIVPLYYNQSRLLRRVVDATLAKAVYHTQPSQRTHKRSLWTYGLALKEVQGALLDTKAATSTETICAIRMLQIYELLEATTIPPEESGNPNPFRRPPSYSSSDEEVDIPRTDENQETWLVTSTQRIGTHSKGMQTLIKTRAPSSFRSEMDKSLFCSLLEGFWLQAYTSNVDFFLESPEWRDLVHSLWKETDAARHPLALDLWVTIAPLSRLLRQTSDVICFDSLVPKRESMQGELQTLHTDLYAWMKKFEAARATLPFSTPMYQELLGFGLGTLALVCRMLVALDPLSPSALHLEAEAQTLCQRTFSLRFDHIVSSGFFVGVCSWTTAEQWQWAIRTARINGDRYLDKEVYAKWNGMMGRKPHSERRGVPWRKEVDDIVKIFLEEKPDDAGVPASGITYTGLVWYL